MDLEKVHNAICNLTVTAATSCTLSRNFDDFLK